MVTCTIYYVFPLFGYIKVYYMKTCIDVDLLYTIVFVCKKKNITDKAKFFKTFTQKLGW